MWAGTDEQLVRSAAGVIPTVCTSVECGDPVRGRSALLGRPSGGADKPLRTER